MARMIGYRRFGGVEVLEEGEVSLPAPGEGQVLVKVRAAGINPVDYKLFGGLTRPLEVVRTIVHPARWFARGKERPLRGVGQDFAGVVTAVGPSVNNVCVGDEVIGLLRAAPWSAREYGALATDVLTSATNVVPKPASVSFEAAGGLGVAAQTAMGALRRVRAEAGDVIVVAAAAGGVGGLVTQLARARGASVIGIAGPSNADYLRSLGAIPVDYGEGLEQQIKDAAPSPVTAFIDCFGGYSSLAHSLGVPGGRVGSLVPTPAIALRRARFTGGRDGKISDIATVADLIDRGTVSLTIARTYPFEVGQVRAAYTELMGGHVRGKIVITVD
ncbi:NADP-dependent oxidoreductase [uncultured Actinomyces sp.]|uniref:NADP-dependent oxidoreductase n=1 Tax=uncultured Actinomyces sp. TaxID=249061 RepID=UPI00263125EC|nr:NADP-dependent oxidoreductase [uncultured Actinomyces sp.]